MLTDPTKSPLGKPKYPGIYKGLVEQRTDPSRLGRLRVRVVGVHGDSSKVPTPDLPWAFPCTPMAKKSGKFFIPPLGEYVWVMFEDGMGDYPVWMGGWWGAPQPANPETPDGEGASKHIDHPTTMFGGDRWNGGVLILEPNVNPSDAPNNFGESSPLGKHYELDDRKNKEKVKLGDQVDNFLWMNTQKGVMTLELIAGLDDDVKARKPRGLTFNNKTEVLQLYTAQQWQLTVDDPNQFFEVNSRSKYKMRIDDKNKRLEIWTPAKQYFILDETRKRLIVMSGDGRQIVIDDQMQSMTFSGVSGNYMYINESSGLLELRGSQVLNIKSGGAINISAGGAINANGTAIYLNCGGGDNSSTLTPLPNTVYVLPPNPVKATRAPDA